MSEIIYNLNSKTLGNLDSYSFRTDQELENQMIMPYPEIIDEDFRYLDMMVEDIIYFGFKDFKSRNLEIPSSLINLIENYKDHDLIEKIRYWFLSTNEGKNFYYDNSFYYEDRFSYYYDDSIGFYEE